MSERNTGHATDVDGLHEPEKLIIPAEAVAYLLNVAVQNQVGNAWWNGFVTAHGVPSWVAQGQWQFEARDVAVIKAPPRTSPNGAIPQMR